MGLGKAWKKAKKKTQNKWDDFADSKWNYTKKTGGWSGFLPLDMHTKGKEYYNDYKDSKKKDKVDAESTLTPEQQGYLANLTDLNSNYLPSTMSALGGLAYMPQNNYDKLANAQTAFQTGVADPSTNLMNQAIAGTQHSSTLHAMANTNAQNQMRSNLGDQLAGLRYDQIGKERTMQLKGIDTAQANQMSALTALNNLSGQALGVRGVENIVSRNPSNLDYINTGINAYGAMR
jgi:hypothetical protein